MADLDDAYAALQKADAAGDSAGAKQLADYIRTQQAPSNAAAPPAPSAPKVGPLDYISGIPETVLRFGSSALAAPISGIAGLGQMMNNRWGISPADPADVVRQVQQNLTYSPGTTGGKALTNAISYPFQKFAELADTAGANSAAASGSPAYGAATNAAIQALPLLFGTKIPGAVKAAPALSPEVASAVDAGFRLTPEQAGAGFIPRAIQSISNSAKLERTNSLKNAPLVNNLAKEEIGVSPDQSLGNSQTFTAAKAPHNAVYGQVSKLGTIPVDSRFQSDIANLTDRTGSGSFGFDVSPQVQALKDGYGSLTQFDAADAVNKVRQLRRDSNANQKIYDPEKSALGQAQRSVADALDNQLDRHVQTLAQSGAVPPDLISQLRNSRAQLAKINTVENSMVGPNVSAKLINKQDRGQLSGNLATISNAYENFDRSFQDASKVRDSGPFGVLSSLFGLGLMHEHPEILGAVLGQPLARSALSSKLYQKVGIQGGSLMGTPDYPALLGSGKLLPLLTQPKGLLTQDQQ
jgi:hypothetical protein